VLSGVFVLRIKASDLRMLDVINISDGRRLGYVYDVDMDIDTGEIIALILPGEGRGFWLYSRHPEIEIPWDKVIRIGEDVILVELGT